MSDAHVLPLALDRALRTGRFTVPDPGASGTISWANKERLDIEIKTAGAESRTLQAAGAFAVGTTAFVNLAKATGALTLNYNATSIVLDTAGQFALFKCVSTDPTTNPETRVWALIASSVFASNANSVSAASTFGTDDVLVASDGTARGVKSTAIDKDDVVTRAANAAGAGLIPQSAGANKALTAVTPVALGSFTFNTGDATSDAKLVLVVNKLVALGLFTGTAS